MLLVPENLGSLFSRLRKNFEKNKKSRLSYIFFFILQVNDARKPEVKVAQKSNIGKSGTLEDNSCPSGQLQSVKHGGK